MENKFETRPEGKRIEIDPDKQVEIFLKHLEKYRGICKEIKIDPEQQIKIFLAKLEEYNIAELELRAETENLNPEQRREIISALAANETRVREVREKVYGTMTAQLA
jgi:hypothetical protein